MLQDKLSELLNRLNELHSQHQDVIRPDAKVHTNGGSPGSDAQPLARDIEAVIHLDRSCRASLEPVVKIVENIEIPYASYLVFTKTASEVLATIVDCRIHVDASAAHTTVDQLIQSGREFSLQEIFTLISVIIMIVSLCIAQLSEEQREILVRKLDKLLNIKLQHLKLMNALVTTEETTGWLS